MEVEISTRIFGNILKRKPFLRYPLTIIALMAGLEGHFEMTI
jgi:hypothetical protein